VYSILNVETNITKNCTTTRRQLTLHGRPLLLTTSVVVGFLSELESVLQTSFSSLTQTLDLSHSLLPRSILRRIRLQSLTVSSLRSSMRRLRTVGLLSTQHGHALVNSFPGEDLGLWLTRELFLLFFSETIQPYVLTPCPINIVLNCSKFLCYWWKDI